MNVEINLTHEILMLIAEIDSFKGGWQAFGRLTPDRLNRLRKVATTESIASSTRIEGVKLSDLEVEKLLQNLNTASFRTRDEQEVAGYAECMHIVFESFQDLPLNENYIKQLHSFLLKFSDKDTRHRGTYKKIENNVVAFDGTGKNLGIIFKTASPFETPLKMKELLDWTNEAFDNAEVHPLLVIAIFNVHFLAIHPFQDGNGRLSRILTSLLLIQNGYGYVLYSSLERVIEQRKDDYYLSLRKSQQTLYTDNSQINIWILFFLNSLKSQKDYLLNKVEREHLLNKLSSLSQEIITCVKDEGSVKVADLERLTRANRNTIKVHLKDLVNSGHLEKLGQGKGTSYILPSVY